MNEINRLLLPPIILLILAQFGLAYAKNNFGVRIARVSLLLLLLMSMPVFPGLVARYWESYPPLVANDVSALLPQAIVVIGGGFQGSAGEFKRNVAIKSNTLLRLRYAAKLARENDLPVLVSGGKTLYGFDISEAELMAEVLENEFGIAVAWQETESYNTAQNARLSWRILQSENIRRILLVTQAYHMPRAAMEFRKAGFQVLPASTAYFRGRFGFSWTDLIPSVYALEQVFLLAHEMAGMLWYSIRY